MSTWMAEIFQICGRLEKAINDTPENKPIFQQTFVGTANTIDFALGTSQIMFLPPKNVYF